jgi:hypothetical protein
MPAKKTEDIKKHGDTLEPLIDRTGGSTQRSPSGNDEPAWRRDEGDKDAPNDGA